MWMDSTPTSLPLIVLAFVSVVAVPLLPTQYLYQPHEHIQCIREEHGSGNDGIWFCLGVHVSSLYDDLGVVEDVPAEDEQSKVQFGGVQKWSGEEELGKGEKGGDAEEGAKETAKVELGSAGTGDGTGSEGDEGDEGGKKG